MTENVEEPQVEEDEVTAADGEDGDEGDGQTKARIRLPSRKKLVFAAAGLLLLSGAGAGGWFYLNGPTNILPETAKEAETKPAMFYDLPDITVNLADPDRRSKFLRLKVSLEVSDRANMTAITPMLPRVMDTFQVYLRELRINDLEGSAGIYRLKEELRRRVNLAVHPAQVDDILFKELLIQ